MLAEIMAGNASEIEIAAFLIALRTKGETVEEIAGLATTMRRLATPVTTGRDDLVDTAGTGGGRPTFNVSTTAALIAAGAGCAVAKHGNRSATGLSGSADVLEALGARIDLAPGGGRALHRRGRLRLHVRARPPRRHALRRPGAQGARRADDLQLPRPADQPGRRHAPAHRRLRPRLPGDDRRRAGAAGRPEGVGSVQRRRTGRDEHVGTHHGRRGRRRRDPLLRARSGGRRAAPKPPDAVAGGTPEDNAAATRAIFAGEAGPGARPRRAQRRRGDLRRGPRRRRSRRACARPSRRSTRAPPPRRSTRSWR